MVAILHAEVAVRDRRVSTTAGSRVRSKNPEPYNVVAFGVDTVLSDASRGARSHFIRP
jgi:hypothetical protein